MKHRNLLLVLLVVVIIIVTLYTIRHQSAISASTESARNAHADHTTKTTGTDNQAHKGINIAGLQTSTVIQSAVTSMITVTGDVQADEEHTARVGSPVAGRLVQLTGTVGQHVSRGETLAVVASRDVAEVQSALTRARAEEKAARVRLQTVRELAQTGALTQKPLEEARSAATTAQAEVAQAEAALARAVSTRTLAAAELARKRKLAEANAFQARPVEEAQGEVAKAQAELDTALAAIKVRQAAYDRSKRLFDAGVAARRDVENAEAELAEARAEEHAARTHLEVARQALNREQNIASQGLYTSAEVHSAENALRQAERDVDGCKAELTRARGQLSLTHAILAREQNIAQRDLTARQGIQEAESALAKAHADVQATENALRAFRAVGGPQAGNSATLAIVAPINGEITERRATPGQAVEATTDLFTIVNTDYVWVWANVYEKDLAQVHVGDHAELMVTTFPGVVFRGTVAYIGTDLKADTRTARIRCEVANPQGKLKAGMFATVNLATGKKNNAILIPAQAVLDETGKKIVFSPCMECPEDKSAGKCVCGTFDKHEVSLGPRHGTMVEVLTGLAPGMTVVTTGQFQLKSALGSGQLEAGCCGH